MGGAGDNSAIWLQSSGRGQCEVQVTMDLSIALHQEQWRRINVMIDVSRGLEISKQCLHCAQEQVTKPVTSCRPGTVQAQRGGNR